MPQDPGSGADWCAMPVFALPTRLSAKADPVLIAGDEAHFAAIAESLESSTAELSKRLDSARLADVEIGQEVMERDEEIHRLTARLRALRRYGLDLCLGRIVGDDTVYIGRLGLTDADGRRLLVDWRSPAAEAFFGATHANPMGLASRRRYRWSDGHIVDYWDEVFSAEGLEGNAALDDQSAFIASLGSSRSERMRDVLGTIQSDQDAIIRASSRGPLVVDGGPGTGKTVVALHRTAYLLYADARLATHGGVLVVGPHRPYLDYVSDVLPSLGEEGVQSCTVRDLVPQGATAGVESDLRVARIKGTGAMVEAIEPAVRVFEEPPTTGSTVETPWAEVWLSVDEWAEAFAAAEPGVPHNEARDQVWAALVEILVDKLGQDAGDPDEDFDAYGLRREHPSAQLRRSLAANRALTRAFDRAWPLLEATDLVGYLLTVPALLRRCAPWLAPDEVAALQRDDPEAWTDADLPLLDAARRLLGDPEASLRRRRREAAAAEEKSRMAEVVADLIASDDSDMRVMSMLRGQDLRETLVDEAALPGETADLLAGPFAHIVVDEAQELTDAEWQMLLQRCPSRSLTIVGDRAQARHGFTESWRERLARIGLDEVELASLTINYRTPQEVMDAAAPVIRAALPDANVPVSVRSTGVPVAYGSTADRDGILDAWLAENDEGVACVIGDATYAGTDRIQSLTPVLAKGLEFDLVVLVDPQRFGEGIEGAVDRYVAMTRATQRLVVLTT